MSFNTIMSSAMCRTCEKTSELYFTLTTRNEKHPEKTLSDMLLELAKIDVTSDNVETLPQQLCITCTQRLKNAYDFVFQAQQINQRLLESVCEVEIKGDIDCLLEEPFDTTSHEFIQIKMEAEASEEAPIFAGTDHSVETKIAENAIPKDESVGDESDDQWRNSDPTSDDFIQIKMEVEASDEAPIFAGTEHLVETKIAENTIPKDESVGDESDDSISDPTYEEFNDDMHRSSSNSDDSDGQEEPVRRLRSSRIMSAKRIVKKKTNEEDSASDNEYLPTKRRRGRPRSSNRHSEENQCDQCDKVFIRKTDLTRHKRVHLPDADRYKCPHCERKFLQKSNMQTHIKLHSKEAKPVKVKTVDVQLCKPHGCKRIECMICHTKHRKISDLRTHLSTHQHTVPFAAVMGDEHAIESISQALYPEEETPLIAVQLIKRIMSDIKAKQFERFYSITNEAGYELSLESSETDSEPEANNSLSKCSKYKCELCPFDFQRKYQLYAHQHVYHVWKDAFYTCEHCKARFINDLLLEHHMRTLCRNTQKSFMCRKCPQRFRWKENFRAHANTHCDTVDVKQVNTTFECHECNRSFQMQKDLTRHMFIHSSESAIFGCKWCPRKFYRPGNLTQHLERHGIAPHELAYAETLINVHKYANGKKVILCKVCHIKFQKIAELRDHLQNDLATHHSYESMLNYSITNQLGFELHLEDSETDDEAKVEGVPALYMCALCHLLCRRKHELFRHQHAMHKLETIEWKCTHCVFKSVSGDLLAYHKRTQCENVEKKYNCTECNLKFMWEDNLAQHIQLHHSDSAGAPTLKAELAQNEAKPIFQCIPCNDMVTNQCADAYV